VSARNVLDAGAGGERGAGGTGATAASLPAHHRAAPAPPNTTNFLLSDHSFDEPGVRVIAARTADGAEAQVALTVDAWQAPRPVRAAGAEHHPAARRRHGLAAHRTAARIVSRGMRDGKARSLLAMDTMPVTGQVMTMALNAVVTDSAPGMSAYVTGQKGNNNQTGVFPDNTPDAFDNPRVEYLGALLRRTRGGGLQRGHRDQRRRDRCDARRQRHSHGEPERRAAIAAQFFDERDRHAVSCSWGVAARHFVPAAGAGQASGAKAPRCGSEFVAAGYHEIATRRRCSICSVRAAPARAARCPPGCSASSTRST
jgi:hypothetical protein